MYILSCMWITFQFKFLSDTYLILSNLQLYYLVYSTLYTNCNGIDQSHISASKGVNVMASESSGRSWRQNSVQTAWIRLLTVVSQNLLNLLKQNSNTYYIVDYYKESIIRWILAQVSKWSYDRLAKIVIPNQIRPLPWISAPNRLRNISN